MATDSTNLTPIGGVSTDCSTPSPTRGVQIEHQVLELDSTLSADLP